MRLLLVSVLACLCACAAAKPDVPLPGPPSPLPCWDVVGRNKYMYLVSLDPDVTHAAAPFRGRRAHAVVWVRTGSTAGNPQFAKAMQQGRARGPWRRRAKLARVRA